MARFLRNYRNPHLAGFPFSEPTILTDTLVIVKSSPAGCVTFRSTNIVLKSIFMRTSFFKIGNRKSAIIRWFLLLAGYYFILPPGRAQTDTTTLSRPSIDTVRVVNAIPDTILIKKKKPHSPRRATMLAAVLPGTGQLYNKRYWKAPLVYIGFGIIGYFIYDNNRNYQNYLQAFTALNVDNGANKPSVVLARYFPEYSSVALDRITVDALRRYKNTWLRYLEISVLSAGAFYALQIVDANVDAHLRGFDWNNDSLSLRFEPVFESNYAGVGLVLRW